MKRYVAAVIACLTLALGLSACGPGNSKSGSAAIDYADDEAMAIIAKGWEKRADYIEENPEQSAKQFKGAIEEELDVDEPLKDRQFKDSKLQEKVIAYINILDEQLELTESYSETDLDFFQKWQSVYDERSSMIRDFAENYDLTVGEKYADDFNELLRNGKAADRKTAQKDAITALISNANWEAEEDPYGGTFKTYVANVQNTSEYNFSDVSLNIGIYDANNVRTETFANVTTWRKGDTVKVEFITEADVQRIEAVPEYYTVDE